MTFGLSAMNIPSPGSYSLRSCASVSVLNISTPGWVSEVISIMGIGLCYWNRARLSKDGVSFPSSMLWTISTTLSFIGVGTPALRPKAHTTPFMASTSVFLPFSRSCSMLAFSLACLRIAIGIINKENAFLIRPL